MAAGKKARKAKRTSKRKAPAARKKSAATKRPARRKAAPARATRRKPARKRPSGGRAPARRPAPVRRAAPAPAPPPRGELPPGQRIGIVTHYFSGLCVAVVKLDSGTLRVGDAVHFRGHTTDFAQRVDSLQVNHVPVLEVGPDDDFGIKVREGVREHDVVYKVK